MANFSRLRSTFLYVTRTFTKSYVRNLETKNEMILCKMTFVNVENYICTISVNQNLTHKCFSFIIKNCFIKSSASCLSFDIGKTSPIPDLIWEGFYYLLNNHSFLIAIVFYYIKYFWLDNNFFICHYTHHPRIKNRSPLCACTGVLRFLRWRSS